MHKTRSCARHLSLAVCLHNALAGVVQRLLRLPTAAAATNGQQHSALIVAAAFPGQPLARRCHRRCRQCGRHASCKSRRRLPAHCSRRGFGCRFRSIRTECVMAAVAVKHICPDAKAEALAGDVLGQQRLGRRLSNSCPCCRRQGRRRASWAAKAKPREGPGMGCRSRREGRPRWPRWRGNAKAEPAWRQRRAKVHGRSHVAAYPHRLGRSQRHARRRAALQGRHAFGGWQQRASVCPGRRPERYLPRERWRCWAAAQMGRRHEAGRGRRQGAGARRGRGATGETLGDLPGGPGGWVGGRRHEG